MKRLIPLLMICLLPMAAQAGEVDSTLQKFIDLEEVVIRSFKQNKTLKMMPASTSKVTGTAIDNQHLVSIKEISGMVPNVFMPDYGSKYTSPVYIRGVGSKSGDPSVGLYVDGIPYFNKSAFGLDLEEVERIEVLRGPQGTLYGRNAMGGLIDVHTRSPLDYQSTRFQFSGGNYNDFRVRLSHAGTVGENFGYALTGNYHHHGGYFDNLFTGAKADKMDSGNGRLRMDWRVNPSLRLGLTTVYDQSDQGANAYAKVDTKTMEMGQINYNNPSGYKRKLSTTGFTLEYGKRRFQLNYQHSLQYAHNDLHQDQDFTEADKFNSLVKQRQLMTSGELNMKVSTGRKYSALFGLFGFYQNTDMTARTIYPTYSTVKQDDIPTYGLAVYHQSVVDSLLCDGLSLTLGLRYDFEHARRDYSLNKDNQLVNGLDGTMKFSQLVPKVALQYTFASSGQVYASVSKGYKTGGFNTSFNVETEKSYGPESSWNYEIGAKHPFLDKLLNAEVAVFWIDWRNQQIQQKVETGGYMIRNAGRSVSRGVELSLQYNPISGLMMAVNYGYTNAEFRKYRKDEQTDYGGNSTPLVPNHTLGANVNYTRSIEGYFIDRYQVGMSFTGNGRIYWDEANSYSQPFYGLLNVSASASRGKVSIGLWAKNITNTKYMTYMFSTSTGSFAQQGRPLTIGGTVTVSL